MPLQGNRGTLWALLIWTSLAAPLCWYEGSNFRRIEELRLCHSAPCKYWISCLYNRNCAVLGRSCDSPARWRQWKRPLPRRYTAGLLRRVRCLGTESLPDEAAALRSDLHLSLVSPHLENDGWELGWVSFGCDPRHVSVEASFSRAWRWTNVWLWSRSPASFQSQQLTHLSRFSFISSL